MFSLATAALLLQGFQAPFDLPDGDFEMLGALWESTPFSAVDFVATPGVGGEVRNHAAHFPAGGNHTIRYEMPVGPGTDVDTPSTPDHLGTKVDFGLWFRRAETGFASGDLLSLRIEDGTRLLASASLDPSAVPEDRWHRMRVAYDVGAGSDGCLRNGTSALTVVVTTSAGGELWIDDVEGRPFERFRCALADAGFEGTGTSPWSSDGTVSFEGVPAYYGRRCARLDGAAAIEQRIACQVPGAAAQDGDLLEAGLWFRVDGAAPLGADTELVLRVFQEAEPRLGAQAAPGHVRTLLAERVVALAGFQPDRWHYVETLATGSLPLPPLTRELRRPRLRLRIALSGPGVVYVDDPGLGQEGSVDGNPERLVYANYVARFRNPDFAPDPMVDAETNDLGKRWRNWYWGSPPTCDPGSFEYLHDPRTVRTGSDPHDASRRDLAISSWETRSLPLLGAYDSRDPAVIDFHVRLADAAGLDALMFGWYGQKAVELDECAPRNQSVNGPALDALYEAIEDVGSDLKVATKMNLLRHANDAWADPPPGCDFESEDTLEKKREGVRDDFIWLVERYYDHRATLKREGRMVLGVFDPDRTFPVSDGPPTSFSGLDWVWIKEGVEAATGKQVLFLFDVAPLLSTPLDEVGDWFARVAEGTALWRLAPCEICRFTDFTSFQEGVANDVSPEDVRTHFRDQVLGRPYRWWRLDDGNRIGVAIAYPGYDDSGVSGWGNPNGTCAGGGTRCTRVVSPEAVCAPDGESCFVELAFEEADRSGMSWIQIPTWNDWNELTAIEPRYSALYVEDALSRLDRVPTGPLEDREWVLGRLLATQRGIARFKRETAVPNRVEAVVLEMLRTWGGTPYD